MKKIKIKSNLQNLPEIKWSYPTDKELLNEIRTEFAIEKLFITEMWPKNEHYADAIIEIKKVSSPEKLDPKKIKGRHLWDTYEALVKTVTSFGGPKDPDAMLASIKANKPLPMPIVVKTKDGDLIVAGGATRSGIAALANQSITALVIDEKKANELMADRLEKQGDIEAQKEKVSPIYKAVKNYFLQNGPKPEFEDNMDNFYVSIAAYRYERIARLRGIDVTNKMSELGIEKKSTQKTKAKVKAKMKAKILAALRKLSN